MQGIAASNATPAASYTAFLGVRRIATGALPDVARAAAAALQASAANEALLVFDDETSLLAELDLRGTPDEAAARATQPPTAAGDAVPVVARGRGRPQLGVVAREVTLLPRHWEWLALQPGGASVALRKLVEDARRTQRPYDTARVAQERSYRFLSPIAGNLPGFEEAVRALFGRKGDAFDTVTSGWPEDIRIHAQRLAAPAFETA
jgi:hypothetical protein